MPKATGKPKTLQDALVAVVADATTDAPMSLVAIKKALTAMRGTDFSKAAAKTLLNKAVAQAVKANLIEKVGASYAPFPGGAGVAGEGKSGAELEQIAWREQKIVLPLEECDFPGYTGRCESDGKKLIVELDCCYFNGSEDSERGQKQVPEGWKEMSQDERETWASGALSTGAHDFGSTRISIPHHLREDGRGYVFEEVRDRGNSCVAEGRICYFDYSA